MPFAEQMTKTLLSLYGPDSLLAMELYRNFRITCYVHEGKIRKADVEQLHLSNLLIDLSG